jgi:transposase
MSTDESFPMAFVPAASAAASAAATAAAFGVPDDLATCQAMIVELLTTLRDLRQDHDQVRQRLDLLLRKLYGARAEKFDPNQPLLFADMTTPAIDTTLSPPAPAADTPAADTPAAPKKPGHGRKALPANLRRERRVYELTDAERRCSACQQPRVKIGAAISEQLDFVPASLFVIEHVRCTYACPHCHAQDQPAQVVTAAKPDALFAKGLPGAGLVANVIISKYTDHLPLHRQERILRRSGVELSRKTLCDWMAAAADLFKPLYELMTTLVLRARVLHTDDTTLPVQDPSRDTLRKGRLWVYLGDRDYPYTLFTYTASRKRDGPQGFLGTYRGYLQADAFSGYDGIFANGLVHEVACWAHARRKFYDARSSDALLSHAALARIGQLYAIERAASQAIADGKLDDTAADALRLRLRQEQALPILAALRTWLDEQAARVLPKSPMGQAITYALNQWDALQRYTTAGFLAIDNNVAERAMRAIAVGRKNWLFTGSDKGGATAAVLFSMTSSCERHGLDPFAYLRDVLTRLSAGPLSDAALADLLPDRWVAPASSSPPPAAAPA